MSINYPFKKSAENVQEKEFLTISEFRHELGIPLVLAKKLVSWGEVETVKMIDGTIHVTENGLLSARKMIENRRQKMHLFMKALGPGIITGASDDDPSGIGTYSSVGAKFGFSILWMAIWLLPVMLAVQEVCARIGIVTNRGLVGVLQEHYRKKIVGLAVFLLIIANVINIGADLGAMAASISILLPVSFYLAVVFFAAVIIAMEVFIGYHVYVKILKWLTFSVFAYIAAGFMIHPQWLDIFQNIFIPKIHLSKEYFFAIIAVFGTTITPYLFFWQASEEVEECNREGSFKKNLVHHRIHRMRTDVSTGMIMANVVFFFIVLTTAQILFKNGITNIESVEQAALALKPFVGNYAFAFFTLGIVGTGLLAIPVLAASGAYALSEFMKWHESLELKFSQAKGFYLVIIFSILIGMILNFLHINPILALYYSAFLNGVVALPLLIVIMIVGNDSKIMDRETHPGWVKFFGWAAVIFLAVALIISVVLNIV